jgi:hypothetical protein
MNAAAELSRLVRRCKRGPQRRSYTTSRCLSVAFERLGIDVVVLAAVQLLKFSSDAPPPATQQGESGPKRVARTVCPREGFSV